MFKKILVANRGEIAVRIIRCCREMDIETVAVYSKADETALHVQLASEAVCIGSAKVADSYLNMRNILSAAVNTGCDAIHPGFGFLSENSVFARLCEQCNIKFIGPSADVIDRMGNKSAARRLMIETGVPVVPGSEGSVLNSEQGINVADKIGYPVLIKAAAGGGGRGMRKVFNREDMQTAFATAQAEAKACFGDEEMYIEKLIIDPKHIEFQIIADNYGNVVHLGERDCSVQRKNQKLLEESPSTILTKELRDKMGNAAVLAAKAANYVNVGTIEFVVDNESNFYFIEMNTRIQVEHPITEMVTGIDIVSEQIKIADGLPLLFKQQEILIKGHAIECRINAENPANNFSPSLGEIKFLHFPGGYGVRIDSALYQGYETSAFYDSMIAKVIVHADSRFEAIRRMRRVLEELMIEGINTNMGLQHIIMHHPEFIEGNYNTGFIEKNLEEMLKLTDRSMVVEE